MGARCGEGDVWRTSGLKRDDGAGAGRRMCGGLALKAVLVLLAGVVVWLAAACYASCHASDVDPRVAKLQDKLDAVARLNEARGRTQPVELIQLNVPKWRAEHVRSLVSAYDREGRHPLYWYTRLDGGLYGVEEVVVWRVRNYVPPERLEEAGRDIGLREGVEMALGRRDALLNPCYNYVDMETATVVERVDGWVRAYYRVWNVAIVYMVAKWVDWASLPIYMDGRFTAEGYTAPEMKPIAFVVRYAPHERHPHGRGTYGLGAVHFCKYLDPLADCKDAGELDGVFTVRKVLDDGRWYVRIDAYVPLNRTGLYTFELIAADLRFQGRRCSIMHHTVEVKR